MLFSPHRASCRQHVDRPVSSVMASASARSCPRAGATSYQSLSPAWKSGASFLFTIVSACAQGSPRAKRAAFLSPVLARLRGLVFSNSCFSRTISSFTSMSRSFFEVDGVVFRIGRYSFARALRRRRSYSGPCGVRSAADGRTNRPRPADARKKKNTTKS